MLFALYDDIYNYSDIALYTVLWLPMSSLHYKYSWYFSKDRFLNEICPRDIPRWAIYQKFNHIAIKIILNRSIILPINIGICNLKFWRMAPYK